MRLLNTTTIKLEEFVGDQIPPYAILSHTWGDGEVTFADINAPDPITKAGYEKIQQTCLQAKEDELEYAWVDTCCIDKSSSAELSESINSMYKWYQNAKCCYAYLNDVDATSFENLVLSRIRWFTRGWTLQELLAPSEVVFFNKRWDLLGTRTEHTKYLTWYTMIDESAMHEWRHKSWLHQFSVAQKMSWASNRVTTRLEDIAYCMLGLFDVNMPLLYGEGKNAFLRLQQEIIRNSNDQSILAFDCGLRSYHELDLKMEEPRRILPLADYPRDFSNSSLIIRSRSSASACNITSNGIEITLPILPLPADPYSGSKRALGILNCNKRAFDGLHDIICILLLPSRIHGVYERCSIPAHGRPSCTCTVDYREAARARLEKITIASILPSKHASLFSMKDRVVVDDLTGLETLSYRVSSVRSQQSRFSPMTMSGWDESTRTYTAPESITRNGQYVVTFETGEVTEGLYHDHFYVLLNGKNTLLWRGPLPIVGEHQVFDSVRRGDWNNGEHPLVLIAPNGTHFEAVPKVHVIEAGCWRLHRVDLAIRQVKNQHEGIACLCKLPTWSQHRSNSIICHVCNGPWCWNMEDDI